MKFSEIKHKIKNLGNFKSLEEIKKAGLRIVRNTKTGDYWLIEEEFLKPVLISLNRISKIMFEINELKNTKAIFIQNPEEIKKATFLNEYLNYGKKEKVHLRKTTKNRKFWYILPSQKIAPLFFPYFYTDTYFVAINKSEVYANKELYVIYPKYQEDVEIISAFLNSTYAMLYWEITSISNVPSIVKIRVYDVPKIFILKKELIKNNLHKIKNHLFSISKRPIKSIFAELGFDPNKPIREQEPNPLPDRKALDDIVFDALGLTEEERKEVYWAVAELVQNRLKKAKSV